MAYEQQRLLSIYPNTNAGDQNIVYGDMQLINKAVRELTPGIWVLSGSNERVDGAIVGFSYGQIQVAVDGWDIKFINGRNTAMNVGRKIVGEEVNGVYGFVHEAEFPAIPYTFAMARDAYFGSGRVRDGGVDNLAGIAIVKIVMTYGS